MGEYVDKFLHPDYHQLVQERNQVIERGEKWTGSNERVIIRLDGHEIYVEAFSERIIFEGVDAIQSVIRDISARKNEEDRLERQVEELAVLHSVALAAAEANSEDELIEEITAIVGTTLFPNNFGVMLLDGQKGGLVAHESYRFDVTLDDDSFAIPVLSLWEGITGQVAAIGKAFRTGDVSQEPLYIDLHSTI